MPASEVELQKVFDTGHGLKATVEAGKNGWTVIYADYSTEFKNENDTPENNLEKGIAVLRSHFSELTEVTNDEPSLGEV